eukprot:3013807-Prymnesium_polylepis.2
MPLSARTARMSTDSVRRCALWSRGAQHGLYLSQQALPEERAHGSVAPRMIAACGPGQHGREVCRQ